MMTTSEPVDDQDKVAERIYSQDDVGAIVNLVVDHLHQHIAAMGRDLFNAICNPGLTVEQRLIAAARLAFAIASMDIQAEPDPAKLAEALGVPLDRVQAALAEMTEIADEIVAEDAAVTSQPAAESAGESQ